MKTLQLKQIRIDGGTQPRVEMNQDVLAEYAEHLQKGTTFPPVTVFFDGVVYWLKAFLKGESLSKLIPATKELFPLPEEKKAVCA